MQIKEEIANIDINTLTPVEALMKLNEIKKYVGAKLRRRIASSQITDVVSDKICKE